MYLYVSPLSVQIFWVSMTEAPSASKISLSKPSASSLDAVAAPVPWFIALIRTTGLFNDANQ